MTSSSRFRVLAGLATIVTEDVADTAFTLRTRHNGKMLRFTAATAVTVTVPNYLEVGFSVGFIQRGAGQVTFVAGSGATVENRSGATKTAGAKAMGSIFVDSNSDAAHAVAVLTGDVA